MTAEPSAWAIKSALSLLYAPTKKSRLYIVAHALDAAELRGHTRAVQETAIASIHKAVAVERAAVVEWLRLDSEESTNDTVAYTAARLADEIERGDHHKEQA